METALKNKVELDVSNPKTTFTPTKFKQQKTIPIELLDRLLWGENALKVWREYRNVSQHELAIRVGLSSTYLLMLESNQYAGTPNDWRKLANALNIALDDLIA